MATYNSYTPTTVISKAMFNFDVFGWSNYVLSGTVRVSVSDSFSDTDWYFDPSYPFINSEIFTSGQNEVLWTPQMTDNIKEILITYSQFTNIAFEWKGDYDSIGFDSTANPEDVGIAYVSDINITWIDRSDVGFSGMSGGSSDTLFGYSGGAGDIFLNAYPQYDFTLNLDTSARQTLMHELGHSLGLSHPHSAYTNGVATITADYAATRNLGFDKLGFRTNSAADMYKEYFTIMSYDDQQYYFNAYTPMILDVIALQQAYGEGAGTSGSGNDTITAGNVGYRTYFDTGGIDAIDLSMYTDDGAHLQMGVSITGAAHLVGVAMSVYDARNTILQGGDPAHLRWFYGEYENAIGSSNADFMFGNALDNIIIGQDGDDFIEGGDGIDTLDGGAGADILDGGAGADTLVGGTGNDAYYVDNAGDITNETNALDTEIDTVNSSVTWILGANIEDLTLTGGAAINGTGNALHNHITGNAAANILSGGPGADTLTGGNGSDIYYIDNTGDIVRETNTVASSGGTDTVYSTISCTLVANVENLRLLAAGAGNGTGNTLNNTIYAGAGNNILNGMTGADTVAYTSATRWHQGQPGQRNRAGHRRIRE